MPPPGRNNLPPPPHEVFYPSQDPHHLGSKTQRRLNNN
jgi:hypothetical protein